MIPFWLKICISLEDTKLTNWQTLQDIGCKSRRHWPCSVRNALPSHIQQYIQLLQKQISIVHSLSIIQDNLCLKREKKTTVCYCYKWWPIANGHEDNLSRKHALSNIKSYIHKAWRLFDNCLCQRLLLLCQICSSYSNCNRGSVFDEWTPNLNSLQ